MFGYRVVDLPDLIVKSELFTTPDKFAQKRADSQQNVSQAECSKYQTALRKWKAANEKKPQEYHDPPPAALLEANRKKALSYRLRILADFPKLLVI